MSHRKASSMTMCIIVVLAIMGLKSVTIGSDFSFFHFMMHGKSYIAWYVDENRTSFSRYLHGDCIIKNADNHKHASK